MSLPTGRDMLAIAPQLIVAGFAMLVLLLDAIWPRMSKRLLANLAVLGLVIAGLQTCLKRPRPGVPTAFQNMVAPDSYTAFFGLVLLVGGILSIWLSVDFLERERADHGEYYALVLLTIVGGMVMAASVNLICTFIGLEILSISLYILAGYQTERRE